MDQIVLPVLASWQQEFVDTFTIQKGQTSLLVGPAGTGKTTTALKAAGTMFAAQVIDSLLVISDRIAIRDQWGHVADRYGLKLETSIDRYLGSHGVSATIQSLRGNGVETVIEEAARNRRWLIIADEPAHETKSLSELVTRMLAYNNASKALYVSCRVPTGLSFDAEFRFRSELIFDQALLEAPSTEIHIARFSPSFSLLRRLQGGAGCRRRDVLERV